MNDWVVIAVNVGGWLTVHLVAGYVAHRLPATRLQRDGRLLRIRDWERDGRAYRRLAVPRWKHWLPEAGAFFAGGTSKRNLPACGREAGVERFLVETRRAELAHWFAVAATPLFALWNPALGTAGCAIYAVAANAPCILVQRYNRVRCLRVLARRDRSSASRPSTERDLPRTSGSSMP